MYALKLNILTTLKLNYIEVNRVKGRYIDQGWPYNAPFNDTIHYGHWFILYRLFRAGKCQFYPSKGAHVASGSELERLKHGFLCNAAASFFTSFRSAKAPLVGVVSKMMRLETFVISDTLSMLTSVEDSVPQLNYHLSSKSLVHH